MPRAPFLTADQRAAALSKAADARKVRASLRADLKSGRTTLPALLERVPSDQVVASTRVTALLESLPGYGKTKAAALLVDVGIAPSRRLRGLGPKQQAALVSRITQPAESRS